MELAALFDQTKSPGHKTLFKLTMKRRAVGKPSEGKLPNLKACENGAKVNWELDKLIAAGHKQNVMQAVGNTIKNWKSEDKKDVVPSQHTLKHFMAWGGMLPASPEVVASYLASHAEHLTSSLTFLPLRFTMSMEAMTMPGVQKPHCRP